LEINITVHFALYVTVRLSTADESTANWILGVELCINLWSTFQIFWLQNKVQGDLTDEERTQWKRKKKEMIRSLITVEIIEILIPLAYSMSYVTAFYGPNARLMAGVKNNYWHNTEVIDIKGQLRALFKIAGIDACGAIIIGIFLEIMCEINIFHEYCNVMEKNWITLSFRIGGLMFHVRINILNTKLPYF
jgi:hypothetical protein